MCVGAGLLWEVQAREGEGQGVRAVVRSCSCQSASVRWRVASRDVAAWHEDCLLRSSTHSHCSQQGAALGTLAAVLLAAWVPTAAACKLHPPPPLPINHQTNTACGGGW